MTIEFSDLVRSSFSKVMMKGQKPYWHPSTLTGGKAEYIGTDAGRIADLIVKK